MKFSVKIANLDTHSTGCLIVPVFENKQPNRDCEGKRGQSFFVSCPSKPYERMLLIGCGPIDAFSPSAFKEVLIKAFTLLLDSGAHDATLVVDDFALNDYTNEWKIRQATQLLHETMYSFDELKTNKKASKRKFSHLIFILHSKKDLAVAQTAIEEGVAISEGMELTKNLANLPPNLCTPLFLANEAKRLAKQHPKIKAKILEKKELESLKMGSLLSVAQGSIHPPKLIILEYKGTTKKTKPTVLVGKGITFDTGGNSLKPPTSMIGMKFDMSGGATVYGVFKAVEALKLPVHLIGVIPACENMPGPYATRPDDVVTSMSGQTIEILNTDAEGRLILADALTYCERFNPEAVIDIATLTGACIIALGHHFSGLMGNNSALNQSLLAAGKKANDVAWEMPLAEEFTQTLQSETADMANIAGPDVGAGSIVAGCFLSKFTKKYPWAHLDIAGTACYFSGAKRGACGRPVPLLVQYLIDNHKK